MGRFVNPGNGAFQADVNSEIYVDKTGLLRFTNQVINTNAAFICNSRPRRFGKSVTANMLAAYYSKGSDSKNIFSRLDISKSADYEKHRNQYDVIHFDVQWCVEAISGPEKFVSFITESIIKELQQIYPGVLDENVRSLPDALSLINSALGTKFVVIIDEWDVLIRDEAGRKDLQNEYVRFLRGLFKGAEPMKYISLAYITGILPMIKFKTQSALNNFDEFTMLDAGQMAPYIGFSEDEVKALCQKYQMSFDEVQKWYDGYFLDDCHVYNPKAVVSAMTRKKVQNYWSQTASYKSVLPFISMNFDGLKTAIMEMYSGSEVEVNVGSFQNNISSFSGKDDVLTYLIHLGYLGYDQYHRTAFIPNEEIRQEFQTVLKEEKWDELNRMELASYELLEATLDMDVKTVSHEIDLIHRKYASSIQYNNENSLSCVITIAYLSSMQYYFKPVRELQSGYGFADLVYIPKPKYQNSHPALLIELKWNKKAETAITQIKEKKYPESIEEYTGDILLVGISYDKKTKVHECVIEKYKKE